MSTGVTKPASHQNVHPGVPTFAAFVSLSDFRSACISFSSDVRTLSFCDFFCFLSQ